MKWFWVAVWMSLVMVQVTPAWSQEGPVDEGPVDEGPVDEGPVDEGPVDEGPVDEGPVDEGPSDPSGEEGPVLVPPKIKTNVQAVYPPKAQEEGVEAQVVLELVIADTGDVQDAKVLKPSAQSGYGFEEAALEAARAMKFVPATQDGVPIPVVISYTSRFVLERKVRVVEEPKDDTQGEDQAVVNFSGVALERGTRTPLGGILVTIFRKDESGEVYGFEATTDAEGKFAFRGLVSGEWKVSIESQGYYPFRTAEVVRSGEVTEAVYFVEKGSYNPFDVIVEASPIRKEVTRRVLRREEIELVPGNYGDPVKVVRNLPGVARAPFGSPAIVVRGSSPEDTRTYVNGLLVPLIYHFGGLRSILPLGLVENIEFYPGNMSVRYGQSIGGVLNVELKKLRPEAIHGYVDVNLFDAGVYVEAPVTEDLSIAVSGRRSYIDSVLAFAVPDGAPVDVITAPRYYDWQLFTSWRPNTSHELRFFVFGSDDRIEALFDNPQDQNASLQSGDFQSTTTFNRVMLDHRWTPSDTLENQAMISVGNDVVDASLGEQFFAVLDLTQYTFRDTLGVQLSPSTKLNLGTDVNLGTLDVRLQAPAPRKEGDVEGFGARDPADTISVRQDGILLGGTALFAELELKAIEDLLVVPGVRVDMIQPIEALVVEPRINARYSLRDDLVLKGGVGIFNQPPSPDETLRGFGNPELEPEQAVHYALGVEWQALEYLSVDVTGFYKDLRNMVSRSSDIEFDEESGEAFAQVYNNGGQGRVYGAEFLIKHQFNNGFFGWISYTLSRAERLDFGETEYRLFDVDQTHILTVIGSQELSNNWTASFAWRLTSGNPDTPVIGGVFDVDQDRYTRISGPVNSVRDPLFHQLDLRVDKRWIYDTWTFTMYLDIQNAYNRKNSNFLQYNFDFSQSRPGQGVPLLPVLGAKADF